MWLSDFRVVLKDRVLDHGAVRLEGTEIAEIAETPVADAAVNGNGLLLMPGFIDMHGDMIEREVEPRPTVKMPFELGLRDLDRRLKTAGVTTAYAAVGFSRSAMTGRLRSLDHSKEMLRALKKMRPHLAVDHKVHARLDVTFPDVDHVVEALIADGTVDLVSLMDHTPGQGQYRDIEKFIQLKEAAGIPRAEAETQVAEQIRHGEAQAGSVLNVIRRLSEICHQANLPIASHDDDTLEKVALMIGIGAAISEFPVTGEAARAAHEGGLLVTMGAPNALRGQSYSGNLSAREAHAAGVLDILAADYHPSAILPAVLVLAQQDPDGLPGAARLATANPARALGLSDRGEIASGKRADLIIADDEGVGHIRSTLVHGRLVYSDGSLGIEAAAGKAKALAG